MDKINTIREKCIEANPSIKDLVFGCVIKRRYEMYSQGTLIGEDNGTYYVQYDSISQISKSQYNIQQDEIIGRPIRLADVLLAIDKADNNYSISAWGGFEKWRSVSDTKDTFMLTNSPKEKWNLLKDDLTQQSNETIDFLYELLK